MQQTFQPLVDTLIALPALWIGLIFVLGLLVGSFLNVVIHRLPIMLDRDWHEQAKAILAEPRLGEAPGDKPVEATPQIALATSDAPTVDLATVAPAPAEAPAPADPAVASAPTYNLVVPRSACPKCGAQITALQNIPVVSYLILGGKCANCRTPISIRYPAVELATALLSAVVA